MVAGTGSLVADAVVVDVIMVNEAMKQSMHTAGLCPCSGSRQDDTFRSLSKVPHWFPLYGPQSFPLALPLHPSKMPCAPNLRRRIGNALPGRPKMPFMVSFNRTHRFLKAGRCNLKTLQKCSAPLLTTPYHNPLHPNL